MDEVETANKEDSTKKMTEMRKMRGGKDKAPVSVVLPTGCTSKTDCNWICEKMVGPLGEKKDAIDMKA